MRKLTIIFFVFIYILNISAQIQNQSDNSDNNASSNKSSSFGLAVGISASTNGLGGNLTASLNDKFALRLGYEALDLSFSNAFVYNQGDFNFDVSPAFKAGGLSAIFDWYLLKSLYLSAGIMVTDFHLSAKIMSADPITIGEIEYSPDDMGEMNIAVGPLNKIAPYAGIGFGRNISRDKRLAMSFELGAYHTGSYVVDLSGTKLFEANGDPANQQSITNLNETLKGISWSGIYPVIKLGVSYRILK